MFYSSGNLSQFTSQMSFYYEKYYHPYKFFSIYMCVYPFYYISLHNIDFKYLYLIIYKQNNVKIYLFAKTLN